MVKTKILFFSEFYAPINTVQTFRNLKISKYLAKHGFQQYIFTADNNKLNNHELNKDIPEDAKVFKKKLYFNNKIENFSSLNLKPTIFSKFLSLFKDLIFPVDKNIWWVLSYLPKMVRLIKKEKIKFVMIGGYPYSAFVGGYILKKICNIKLILDFHDPWKSLPECLKQSFIRRISHIFWEKQCILNADLITVCTVGLKKEFTTNYKTKVNVLELPNGFDVDDLKMIQHEKPTENEKFTFLYTGRYMLSTEAYNPESMVKAFITFITRYEIYNCELVLIGITDNDTKQFIANLGCDKVICNDLVPKHEVIQKQFEADCLVHFYYPYNHKNTISLKVCEYAMINKVIICFNTNEGALYDLLINHRLGEVADSNNIEDMVNLYLKAYKRQIVICENPIQELKEYNWEYSVEILTQNILTL